MLICISKFSHNRSADALLKETITVVLESARRVYTFKAYEEVKKELCSYFNESCNKLHLTLKNWFFNCFNRSFGHIQWNEYLAVREIEV